MSKGNAFFKTYDVELLVSTNIRSRSTWANLKFVTEHLVIYLNSFLLVFKIFFQRQQLTIMSSRENIAQGTFKLISNVPNLKTINKLAELC